MLRPVKSWIGEISANSSLSPSRRNHSNESRWTLIRLGMGATSLIRANECRAAPSARARETGRASASAMGLLTPPLCAGTGEQTTEKRRKAGGQMDAGGECSVGRPRRKRISQSAGADSVQARARGQTPDDERRAESAVYSKRELQV